MHVPSESQQFTCETQPLTGESLADIYKWLVWLPFRLNSIANASLWLHPIQHRTNRRLVWMCPDWRRHCALTMCLICRRNIYKAQNGNRLNIFVSVSKLKWFVFVHVVEAICSFKVFESKMGQNKYAAKFCLCWKMSMCRSSFRMQDDAQKPYWNYDESWRLMCDDVVCGKSWLPANGWFALQMRKLWLRATN